MVRHQTAQEVCATWGAIVIRICDGVRTDVEDLQRVESLWQELLDSHHTIGMLLVFTHDTPLPTAATQRYAKQVLPRYDDALVLSAAILGLGFWASAFRAGLDALMRIARGGTVAIEGSVEAAAERLTRELVGIDPAALLEVVRELLAKLEHERLAS